MHSERKRCMAWCSKQFFTNKAAFEPNEQVVDQGRVGFGDASQFKPIDWTSSSRWLSFAYPSTRPASSPNIHIGGKSFFHQSQQVFCISTKIGRRLFSL